MRPTSLLFALVCAGGAASAVVLTVHEARYVPALETRVVSATRTGTLETVVAEVRNTTGHALCARLQVAARDREGRDLAVDSSLPAVQVAAGARHLVTARMTVSDRVYRERLQRFDAYVLTCP